LSWWTTSGLLTFLIPSGFGEFGNLEKNIRRLPGRKYPIISVSNPEGSTPRTRLTPLVENATVWLSVFLGAALRSTEPIVFVAHSNGNRLLQPLITAIRTAESLPSFDNICLDPKKIKIQVVQLDPTFVIPRPIGANLTLRVGSNNIRKKIVGNRDKMSENPDGMILSDLSALANGAVDILAKKGVSHNDLLNDYDVIRETQRRGIEY
jgi:hypothetical protein